MLCLTRFATRTLHLTEETVESPLLPCLWLEEVSVMYHSVLGDE